MKKSQKIFLRIGASVIIVIILLVMVVFAVETKKAYEFELKVRSHRDINDFWFWQLMFFAVYMGRLILSGICLLKNGYVFLGDQSKIRKILCVVSSALVIISYIFMHDFQQEYSFIEWHTLIIAFILGSLRFGKRGANIIKEDE